MRFLEVTLYNIKRQNGTAFNIHEANCYN
jgi:hypothetical protein